PAAVWMQAMILLIFAYAGFESALAPMSEAKNPRRDAAFALFVALITCIVIYALVQWVVVGVLGPGATTDRPLAEVAREAMGNRGAALVAFGALISVYGYLSAKLLAMPRITFALAKNGDLPRIFAKVSPTFRTPWFSILFYAAAVWGLAMAGSFAWNATLSVVARLFYYAVVCAALIALRRKQPQAVRFRLPAGPFFALLGIGICVALATQVDLSKSLILAATLGGAVLNWVWARHGDRVKVDTGR
ncbi:MAG TPA: APC family permease, partial [Candidatus Acidoferrum sp.]